MFSRSRALGVVLVCSALSSVACAPGKPAETSSSGANVSASSTKEGSADEAPSAGDDDGSCTDAACVALCEKKGRARDCYEAGNAVRDGRGTKEDVAKAVRLFAKGCDGKERNACYELGELLGSEETPGHDEAKAVAAHTKACELGRGQSCDLLSKRYEAGRGVSKSHAKAIALLGSGCAAEDYQVWTCASLRTAADKKDPDAEKVVSGWKGACAAGDKVACEAQSRLTKK